MYSSIFIDEFYQKEKKEKLDILDVREIDEFENGHIKSAKNIPLSELVERIEELDENKNYYVICHSGGRSGSACQYLSNLQFNVINVMGGMSSWKGEVV